MKTTCIRCNAAKPASPDSYCQECRRDYHRGRYLYLPNDELGRKLMAQYREAQKARVTK